ncbi:MAG: galactokinase [Trueperaceae bacterium]
MSDLITTITETFKHHFSTAPNAVVRAPGRVNLIGEHTDYNDGFVFPMAIDRTMFIALRPRKDRNVRVYSIDFDAWGEFDLDNLKKDKGWLEYLKGMAWALQNEGYTLGGWEGVLAGDVPRGSGLSSSAALEMATARAFFEVSSFPWQPAKMAQLGQKTENQWVGANTGIMDQMISASGQKGYALLIDCRSLETSAFPLPPETVAVVMDTMTRHSHTESGYNERRAECEEAAKFFGVKALRDVTLEQFSPKAEGLPEVVRRRAQHVITENDRTLRAAKAMKQGDAASLGKLMSESGDSLRYDFEVTNGALDTMVDIAKAEVGCFGARMTGGGFGGCAVALVAVNHAETFVQNVAKLYKVKTGLEPQIYVCEATEGASTLS